MLSLSKILAASAVLSVTSLAHAQDQSPNNIGWYVGGALGAFSEKLHGDVNHTQSFAVYGGYNFTEWFGLDSSFFVSGDLSDDNKYVSHAAYGALSFTPKLMLHVSSNVSLFAKAGPASLAYAEEDKNYYGHKHTNTWGNIVWTYGLGADFAVSKGARIRLAYEGFSGKLEADDNNDYLDDFDSNIHQIMLGVHYQF